MGGEGSEGKKHGIISVMCARNARACARNVDRVGERCFLGLVLKEGGGFVHLRDDLITSSEMICSTSDVVRFPSEVIFSTSEIEKTTSEVVGFISDAVLWFLDARRSKRGRNREGGGEGMGIELMSDFCQIEASKLQCWNFFENFSAGLFGGNGSLLYFCTRNRDARLSCSLRYALPQGGRGGRNDCNMLFERIT